MIGHPGTLPICPHFLVKCGSFILLVSLDNGWIKKDGFLDKQRTKTTRESKGTAVCFPKSLSKGGCSPRLSEKYPSLDDFVLTAVNSNNEYQKHGLLENQDFQSRHCRELRAASDDW